MRIAVANLKGGVGKTTTAVHLATGLGRRAPTVLIDCDSQGSAARWAQLAPQLPFRTEFDPQPDLEQRFGALTAGATHVVVDTPPGHLWTVRSAVRCVERVLIPVEPLVMDLDRLAPTIELMGTLAQVNDPTVHMLLTRVRWSTRSARSARELLMKRGLPVLDTEIPLLEGYGWAYGAVPSEGTHYAQLLDELVGPAERVA